MEWLRAWWQGVTLEWQHWQRDRWLLSLLTLLPLLMCLLLWNIFGDGIPRQLPVALVDHDQSEISRHIARTLDSSAALEIEQFANLKLAESAFRNADVYAIVYMPNDFSDQVLTYQSPQLPVYFNSQYQLVGRFLVSRLQTTLMQAAAGFEWVRLVASDLDPNKAQSQVMPVRTSGRALFNPNVNYSPFLLAGVLPAMWQIFVLMGVIYSLGNDLMRPSYWQLPHVYARLLGKLALLFVPLWLQGVAMTAFLYGALGWSMYGSWMLLVGTQLLTTFAAMGLGIFCISLNGRISSAMGVAAILVAPGFAFFGVTFPSQDMGSFAQLWQHIMPMAHYVKAQTGIVTYGWSVDQLLPFVVPFFVFSLLGMVALRRTLMLGERVHD